MRPDFACIKTGSRNWINKMLYLLLTYITYSTIQYSLLISPQNPRNGAWPAPALLHDISIIRISAVVLRYIVGSIMQSMQSNTLYSNHRQ